MANYATLIAAIQSVITQNGNNEITGPILQQTLISVVNSLGSGYQFIGIATPETTPGTPDQKVFYIGSSGTYPNFGPAVIPDGNLAVFYYDSSWHYGYVAFPVGDGSITQAKIESAFLQKLLYGYVYAGVALPGSNPGSPIRDCFFVASTVGVYANFGGIQVNGDEIAIIKYDSTAHTFEKTTVSLAGLIEYIGVRLVDKFDADFSISDPNGNEIVVFEDGHIRTKEFNSKTVKIYVGDTDEYDYGVCDESGNFIFACRNGHILTKNFDSEQIDAYNYSIKKFKNKKIAIIGDSISTYSGWLPSDVSGYDGTTYATYYPNGNVNDVSKTWWYMVAKTLGISTANINNCSWSGSKVTGNGASTTSASAACSDRRISDLAIRGFNPDIVLVFISCNDWAANIAVGSWSVESPIPANGTISTMREAYALMLNKIHIAYPNARIFCCTILDDYRRDATSGWPSNNGNGVSTYAWNRNIIEIANALGCDVIDMNQCGLNYSNIAANAVDTGLHPNANGMVMMAQKVVADLIAKY